MCLANRNASQSLHKFGLPLPVSITLVFGTLQFRASPSRIGLRPRAEYLFCTINFDSIRQPYLGCRIISILSVFILQIKSRIKFWI